MSLESLFEDRARHELGQSICYTCREKPDITRNDELDYEIEQELRR